MNRRAHSLVSMPVPLTPLALTPIIIVFAGDAAHAADIEKIRVASERVFTNSLSCEVA